MLAKIEEFEWEFNQRNKIANNYSNALENYITTPKIPDGSKSIWAQYTLKHEKREIIQEKLREKGIPTMVYYPIPMHMQAAYKKYYKEELINAEKLSQEVFSIPMYPDMSAEIQEYVISNLVDIL